MSLYILLLVVVVEVLVSFGGIHQSWWQVLNVDHIVVSAIIAGVCCPPPPVTKCIMLVYQRGGAWCNDKIIGALITQ